MVRTVLFLTWALGSINVLAQSLTCPAGQLYNDITGFPATTNAGCYPLNFLSTSDLGNTTPAEAQNRCQQQCTNLGTGCGSVVVQINKAGDSGLYSGTCFYFAPGNTPTGPRTCESPAYLLQGFVKDNTLSCLSSSTAVATSFCQSVLKNTVTSTFTTTPRLATLTITKTLTATAFTTTSLTTTVSATAFVTVSTTITASTTVATTTSSITQSVTSVSTKTSIITSFVTTTVPYGNVAARAVAVPGVAAPAPVAAPACVTSGTPNSRLSSACSCFSASPATTTKTVTAPTPLTRLTVTTTKTNTLPVTVSNSITVTSATSTLTSSITTTLSLTATTSTTITSTTSSFVTQFTTVTSTVTTTAAPPLQTVKLVVHGSSDPDLASNSGVGYVTYEGFQGSNSVYYVDFVKNGDANPLFTINPATGELKSLNGPGNAPGEACYYADYDVASYINISPYQFAADQGGVPCNCKVVSGKLQCAFKNDIADFWTCAHRLNLIQPGFDFTDQCADAFTAYKVEVWAQVV